MSRSISIFGWILAVALLSVAFGSQAFAQLGKGVVAGTVTDPTGAVVSGANVTLISQATGVQRTAQTNEIGLYRFDFVDVGPYTLRATAPGFTNYEVQDLVVTVAQTVTSDVKLELGRAAQTV